MKTNSVGRILEVRPTQLLRQAVAQRRAGWTWRRNWQKHFRRWVGLGVAARARWAGWSWCGSLGGAGCVWALMAVHASANWSQFILDDGLPGYLRDVLGLSLATAGLLASLPAALKLGLTLAAAASADYLRGERGPAWATTVRVRKLFAAMAIAPQMLMLLFLSGGGAAGSPTLVMVILIVCDGLTGLASGGGCKC
eukprot:SAG22_NODE_5022_length_1105_cov_1.179920_2_plen_196_part_00